MSYLQLIIVGNLGKEPETRYTPNGTQVTSLNVATNRKYTESSGQVAKETTWVRVSVFGKAAAPCAEYLHKGSEVLVEGRLTPDKDTGSPRVYQRPDGTYGSSYEMIANVVRFLGSSGGGQQQQQATSPQTEADDTPF